MPAQETRKMEVAIAEIDIGKSGGDVAVDERTRSILDIPSLR